MTSSVPFSTSLYQHVCAMYSHNSKTKFQATVSFTPVQTESKQHWLAIAAILSPEILPTWLCHMYNSWTNTSAVSCTCSCVFYNGYLFMKYILARGYLCVTAVIFFLMRTQYFRLCTCGLSSCFFHGTSTCHFRCNS